MRIFSLFVVALIAVSCGQSNSSEAVALNTEPEPNTQYSMKIEGMTCQSGCKKLIEKKMAQHPGVTAFDIDFESETAIVKFDETMTDTTTLRLAVSDINEGAYAAKGIAESYEKTN
ncbi:MAG: cation transporter [Cryomorphaceae bacterium]|nr:cation transporter [Cryomorphaceae bacterium]